MAVRTQPATHASLSPWSAVARAVALLTVAVSVLLAAFAWPSVRSSVHDVPIAVAGPAPAVRQISAALDERLPDAFEITEVPGTAAAEQLIRDREVYGAIDVSSGTPQVILASAGSGARSRTAAAVLAPWDCAWLSAVAMLLRVWATAALPAEARMTCGVPELTSIAP